MKRRWMMGLLLTGYSAMALSQAVPDPVPGDAAEQRIRINSLRQQKSAELDREEAACLSRFAVTDCQNQVGVRRREMLTDLKRQESSLNAVERLQKNSEKLLHAEQKAAESVQRQQEAMTAADNPQTADRQKTLDGRLHTHQQKAQPTVGKAPVAKPRNMLEPKVVEKNREAFVEKQKALEKRRQERDQRLLDHGKGAPALPLPP